MNSYKIRQNEDMLFMPTHDCCNHENSKTFTFCYLADPYHTIHLKRFNVVICDNCGCIHILGRTKFHKAICRFLLSAFSDYHIYTDEGMNSKYIQCAKGDIVNG